MRPPVSEGRSQVEGGEPPGAPSVLGVGLMAGERVVHVETASLAVQTIGCAAVFAFFACIILAALAPRNGYPDASSWLLVPFAAAAGAGFAAFFGARGWVVTDRRILCIRRNGALRRALRVSDVVSAEEVMLRSRYGNKIHPALEVTMRSGETHLFRNKAIANAVRRVTARGKAGG